MDALRIRRHQTHPDWKLHTGPSYVAYASSVCSDYCSGSPKLVYSTYLGGSVGDGAGGIAVDGSGNAYVAGGTSSPDFPIVNAVQTGLAATLCTSTTSFGMALWHDYCPSAGFLSVLNPAGAALLWSTLAEAASAPTAPAPRAPTHPPPTAASL
jgi:hypothetical protein